MKSKARHHFFATVVTGEKYKLHSAQLPNLCEEMNVPYISYTGSVKKRRGGGKQITIGVHHKEHGAYYANPVEFGHMLGFLRLRAWDARREHEKKKPRHRFIDEVWPGVKPL